MEGPAHSNHNPNFDTFRECLSVATLRRGQVPMRKNPRKRRSVAVKATRSRHGTDVPETSVQDDPEEAADFINVGTHAYIRGR